MPGLNELISMAKRSPMEYFAEKKKWSRLVKLYALEQKFEPITEPAFFEFEILEPNRKRDPDNMCGGVQKFVFDALQDAGLLENDGWEQILAISHTWKVDHQPGVRLTVR